MGTNKIFKTIFLLFMGFLAGWSTEFGIVFVFLQICLMVYSYFVRKETLPIWYFVGVIAMFVGWFFLYTCPGTAKRVHAIIAYGADYISLSELIHMPIGLLVKTIFHTYDKALRWTYFENYVLVSTFILLTSFLYSPSFKKIIRAVFVILFAGFCWAVLSKLIFMLYTISISGIYAYKFKEKNREIFLSFVYIVCVLFAEFIFIGATIQVSTPRRAGFQYTILNFILIAIVMDYCFEVFKGNFKVKLSAFTFCAFLNLSIVSFVSWECYTMSLKWDLMLKSIEKQKNIGIMDIMVDKETFVSNYWSYSNWSNPDENYSEWPNTLYAEVYGVDTFTAK